MWHELTTIMVYGAWVAAAQEHTGPDNAAREGTGGQAR
jgi:hypothetical protein